MSLDNVGGGVSVQNPADIGQGGVDKAGLVAKSFNRSVSVEPNVKATEGLKSEEPRSEFPSLRERIITPVHSSKTRSIRQLAGQLAGKLADKVVPDKVQEGMSSLKAKASKKAQAALDVVTEKATALKSATIGKLLRTVRNEGFSKIDAQVTTNSELGKKIDVHNSRVDKLAELKDKLKTEENKLKNFRSEYKEALELLEHPEKFTASSKPKTITIPGGETRTINAGDAATRSDMVNMITADIKEAQEYKEYEFKVSQKAAGGTELYQERQNLKKQMKAEAEDMFEVFQKEVSEYLEADMKGVKERKKEFYGEYSQLLSERREEYKQRKEDARTNMESKKKLVADLKEERRNTREVVQEDRETKSRLKKDAADLRSTAARMRSGVARSNAEQNAESTQKDYDHIKDRVGKMKQRLNEIPDALKTERKAEEDARKEFEKLDSGKVLEEELKDSAREWKEKDKGFEREEKQLEKQAKRRRGDFRKGLGR